MIKLTNLGTKKSIVSTLDKKAATNQFVEVDDICINYRKLNPKVTADYGDLAKRNEYPASSTKLSFVLLPFAEGLDSLTLQYKTHTRRIKETHTQDMTVKKLDPNTLRAINELPTLYPDLVSNMYEDRLDLPSSSKFGIWKDEVIKNQLATFKIGTNTTLLHPIFVIDDEGDPSNNGKVFFINLSEFGFWGQVEARIGDIAQERHGKVYFNLKKEISELSTQKDLTDAERETLVAKVDELQKLILNIHDTTNPVAITLSYSYGQGVEALKSLNLKSIEEVKDKATIKAIQAAEHPSIRPVLEHLHQVMFNYLPQNLKEATLGEKLEYVGKSNLTYLLGEKKIAMLNQQIIDLQSVKTPSPTQIGMLTCLLAMKSYLIVKETKVNKTPEAEDYVDPTPSDQVVNTTQTLGAAIDDDIPF